MKACSMCSLLLRGQFFATRKTSYSVTACRDREGPVNNIVDLEIAMAVGEWALLHKAGSAPLQ